MPFPKATSVTIPTSAPKAEGATKVKQEVQRVDQALSIVNDAIRMMGMTQQISRQVSAVSSAKSLAGIKAKTTQEQDKIIVATAAWAVDNIIKPLALDEKNATGLLADVLMAYIPESKHDAFLTGKKGLFPKLEAHFDSLAFARLDPEDPQSFRNNVALSPKIEAVNLLKSWCLAANVPADDVFKAFVDLFQQQPEESTEPEGTPE